MTVLIGLLIWFVLSIPFGIMVGKFIAVGGDNE